MSSYCDCVRSYGNMRLPIATLRKYQIPNTKYTCNTGQTQEAVPETISKLVDVGIRFCML